MLNLARHFMLLTLFALLGACGAGGLGGGSPFGSDQEEIGANDPEANLRIVGVRAEGTPAMFQEGYQVGDPVIYANNTINCSSISVVQLGPNFVERSAADLPEYTSEERKSFAKPTVTDGCQIVFNEPFEPRIDAAIKVTYRNSDVLYAPLRQVGNENESIYVSFGSHLVLKELFENIPDKLTLEDSLPCPGDSDCDTQHRAKARLVSFMAETARLYEYPDLIQPVDSAESSAPGNNALDKLSQQTDLASHIRAAVSEVLRSKSPLAKGTVREDYNGEDNPDFLNGALQTRLRPSDTYNSVFFSMGFSDIKSSAVLNNACDMAPALVLSTSHQAQPTLAAPAVSANELPRLLHNAYYLDFRYDDILPDIPFESSTLCLDTENVDLESPENRYTYLSGASAGSDQNQSPNNGTHLSSEGFFLNDRALNQTLTDEPTGVNDTGVGFDFNPVYYKLYRVNDYEPDTDLTNLNETETPDFGDSPTWLTSAGLGFNAVHEIQQTESSPARYKRSEVREQQSMLTWEVHGLRTDNSIEADDINGKTFGAIEFSIKIDENFAQAPIEVRAETKTWVASGGSFDEQQDNSGNSTAHYASYLLTRENNASVSYTPDLIRLPAAQSRIFRFLADENGEDTGLVYLDAGGRSERPLGHVSQSGDHLAFAIDSPSTFARRGIVLASKLFTGTPDFQVGEDYTYRLSGNYFEMSNTENRVGNLNDSTLIITGVSATDPQDCTATLKVEQASIDHTLSDQTLSSADFSSFPLANSTRCSIAVGGLIELGFSVNGEAVTLKGFATNESPGSPHPTKLMNLLWLQNQKIGLVLAQLDQQLSTTFD